MYSVFIVINIDPPKIPVGEFIYMYQVPWGDNIFLLPLDFKCFMDEYGKYEYLPVSFKATIIEINNYRLSYGNKKRYKFLQYLPLQSMFSFVEVDLKELVSPETLKLHWAELQDREKFREIQKIKDEELEILKEEK